MGLEEYRAIKCVPKVLVDYDTFRREALVLKKLRHPGIPMVYDLEEDEEYFYLIEEYLEGCSLYTLIMSRGTLAEADALRYGMDICSLVEYMHSSCEQPILHLDLQPNNLIIHNGTVRLIDFDHAAAGSDANRNLKRYGTVGCAAPEQYTSDCLLDQRTDVYAIGAVLRFMVHGTLKPGAKADSGVSEALEGIIRKCTEDRKEMRYSSAKEAGEALRRLLAKEELFNSEHKAISSLNVILTGSRSGAGTTHFAFGLCSYLTARGYKALYEEHNSSGAVRTLIRPEENRPDRYGIYQREGCFLKPWYGPAANLPEAEDFSVRLLDFGTDWQEAALCLKRGNSFLMAAAAENQWERGNTLRMLKELGAGNAETQLRSQKQIQGILILRGTGKRTFKILKRTAGLPVCVSPEYEDPFRKSADTEAFFGAVWKMAEAGKTGCEGRRSRFGSWRKAGLSGS